MCWYVFMRFVRIKSSVVPLTIDFGMFLIKLIPLTTLEWIDLARKREKLLKTGGINKGALSFNLWTKIKDWWMLGGVLWVQKESLKAYLPRKTRSLCGCEHHARNWIWNHNKSEKMMGQISSWCVLITWSGEEDLDLGL